MKKQSLLLYLQKCSMYFSTKVLLLDVIALTLSWKPGETLFTCNYLPLSTRPTKLLRFTMLLRWEIFFRPTRKPWWNHAGLLCFYSEVGDLTRPTRKIWLNQAYNSFKVKNLCQIYQKTRKISTRPTRKAW